MIKIKCSKCGTVHNINKENIINNKGKKIIFKCKKCNNSINILIN